MDIDQILSALTAERDRLTSAIEALAGTTKRRGRPPKNNLLEMPKQTRKPRSAASRKKQALAMKKNWAKRKREAKAS